MQVKITRVSKRDTNKDGVKLVGKKYGKPYWNIGIQVEGSDEWMSGFANSTHDPMYNIEEGGTYSISVTEKTVGDKVYKNFKLLTPEEKELEELRAFKAEQDAKQAVNKFEPTNEKEAETSESKF